MADLLVGYEIAQLCDADYRVTWIGEDFVHDYPGPFDQDYMRALFDYGYDKMKRGEVWSELPPQLAEDQETADLQSTE